MNLYGIMFDRELYYVEASSMQRAIEVWRCWLTERLAGDAKGNEEPESCHLVNDDPVIRECPM